MTGQWKGNWKPIFDQAWRNSSRRARTSVPFDCAEWEFNAGRKRARFPNLRRASAPVLLAAAAILFLAVGHGYSSEPAEVGFRAFSYGKAPTQQITGEKPESKLWWNDGLWWGSLYNKTTGAYHIYKFDVASQDWTDTGTAIDDREDSKADVLWDDASQKLYVVSHIFVEDAVPTADPAEHGRLFRYSYDSGTKTYTLDTGFPVNVTEGVSETLVLAKDSVGQLWVTYVENRQVMVNRSLDLGSDGFDPEDDKAWGTPFVLPVADANNLTDDDISSIVAFDGRVGIMWSNNRTGERRIRFAVHLDGQPDTTWVSTEAFTSSDDHINLKVLDGDSAGKVFAVAKTLSSATLIELLVCTTGDCSGPTDWTSHTVYNTNAFNTTRPILLIDTTNRELYVFTRSVNSSGISGIYYKKTDLDNIQFTPETIGELFIFSLDDDDVNNPTSTKQNLDDTTGMLVLASDRGTEFYLHNHVDLLGGTKPDIISFLPTNGPVGTVVTLTGSKFTGAMDVAFHGEPATTFSVDLDTQITANVPAGATTGRISVTASGETGYSGTHFLVITTPTIASFTPTDGPVGTEVTITGSSFTGTTSVTFFNGIAATSFTIDSDAQIRANVPVGATDGPIGVTNDAGTATSATNFDVTVNAPVVSLSPLSLVFDDQEVGTTSTPKTVTVTNTGSAELNISSITTTDDASTTDFAQTNDCAGTPVPANNGSCTIQVTFTPTVGEMVTGTLTIEHDAAGTPHVVPLEGSGTAPTVLLSPTPLAFGDQKVGTTSTALTVTLTNGGNSNLSITGISIPPSDDFDHIHDCPAVLAASDSCTISVTFTPTATGARAGTLTITDNALDSPQTVDLSGTGTQPAVSLSPSSLTFGDQVVGTPSTSQSVTLNNTGTATLEITEIAASGDYGQSNDCVSPLAAGTGCTINVTFTPTATGTRAGTLSISDDAPDTPQTVDLSGTGIQAAVGLAPSSLTFGDQEIGTTSSVQSVTLTNTGTAPLDIAGIAADGDYEQSNDCGSSVDAGASCTIDVTFIPTTTRTRTGSITVDDNAPTTPHVVNLTGSGIVVPAVSLSPTALTFGSHEIGTTAAAQTVTLNNTGTGPLTISSIGASGDYAQSNNCISPVAAGASCTIDVTFTPTATGARPGTLTVSDDAPDTPQTVGLSGTGIQAAVGLSPSSLTFGNQEMGTTSSAQTVTLTNTGTATLDITSIVVSGDFAQTTNCGISVAAGASCAIDVTFTPTATGARAGSISITDDAANSPQTVGLSGTGTQATVTTSPTSLSFGDQAVTIAGAPQTVTLRNTGTAILNITSIEMSGDYAQTNNCGSSVAAGASCTIDVTFTPLAMGPRPGTLTITDNAPDSPQTASLTGQGVAAYALSSNPALVEVVRGTDSVGFTVLASTTVGFAGTIDLTCSGVASAQCTFSPASITPGDASTLNVSNLDAVSGTSLSFSAVGTSGSQQVALPLSVLISDFALSASPGSRTVAAGGIASYSLELTPMGGFDQTVSFTCTGAPRGASCSISPNSVTPNGSGSMTASVSVSTTARSIAPPRPNGWTRFPLPPSLHSLWWMVALMSLLALPILRKRRWNAWPARVALGILVLFSLACGGGSSTVIQPPAGTPAGTYTFTVAATSGDLTHSTILEITVN